MNITSFGKLAVSELQAQGGVMNDLTNFSAMLLEILQYYGNKIGTVRYINGTPLEDFNNTLNPDKLNIFYNAPGTTPKDLVEDQELLENLSEVIKDEVYYSDTFNMVYHANKLQHSSNQSANIAVAAAAVAPTVIKTLPVDIKRMFRDLLIAPDKEVQLLDSINKWLQIKEVQEHYKTVKAKHFVEDLISARQYQYKEQIQEHKEKILSLEQQITSRTKLLKEAQYIMLGLRDEAENSNYSSLITLFKKNKDIIDYDVSYDGKLILHILTKLDNYDIDEAEHFLQNYKGTPQGLFFEEVYLKNTRPFIKTNITLRINLTSGDTSASTPLETNIHYLPNKHITVYNCWSGYKSQIRKAIKDGDLTMAISSAIAGVKNINFADGAVAQEMVDYVRRYHETFNKEYPKKD